MRNRLTDYMDIQFIVVHGTLQEIWGKYKVSGVFCTSKHKANDVNTSTAGISATIRCHHRVKVEL